ncbi:hypothetical protein B0H34DRAFT_678882 [Crassisporium funariophilum]|nr:hypothetical protein B0H34DRAFT_678882 [Crassisporium funariophilum]
MAEIVPNMGMTPGILEPPGVEHLYRDPPSPLTVALLVWDDQNIDILPGDRHWAIAWKVGVASNGDDVYRQIAIVRERGPTGPLSHLTNWGPKTKVISEKTTCIPIATLTYEQRQGLESVAAAEPVLRPNGWWNCQNWVVSVLVKTIQNGIFSREQVEPVLVQAGWTASLS